MGILFANDSVCGQWPHHEFLPGDLLGQLLASGVTVCPVRGTGEDRQTNVSIARVNPWAGTDSRTDRGEVVGLVSREKWAKTRDLV